MREFSYQSGKSTQIPENQLRVFSTILYIFLIYLLFTSDIFLSIVIILSPIVIYSVIMNKLFVYTYDKYTKHKSIFD